MPSSEHNHRNREQEKDPDTDLGIVKVPRKFRITSEWTWRVAAGLLLVMNLYLKGTYVSSEQYLKDRQDDLAQRRDSDDQIRKLNLLVSNMEVRNEINTRQDAELSDHETRIRALENRSLRPTSNPNRTN